MNTEVQEMLDAIRAETADKLAKLEAENKRLSRDNANQLAFRIAQAGQQAEIEEMETRENRTYSLSEAMKCAVDHRHGGFARECSQELRAKLGWNVPSDWVLVPLSARTQHTREVSITGSPSTGDSLLGTAKAGDLFIDVLRARSLAMSIGAGMIDAGAYGLQNISIPRKATASTGYWFAADSTASAITESTPSFDHVLLQPRFCAALLTASYRLMLQSTPAAERMLYDDLAQTVATTVDQAFWQGSGSNNQPTGICNASGINTVNIGSPTTAAWSHFVDLETAINSDNVGNARRAYVTTPHMVGLTKKLEDSQSRPLQLIQGGRINDAPIFATSNMPADTILFGDFADALICTWGAVALAADTSTHFASGSVRLRAITPVDFAVRHAESFAKAS